MSFLLRKLLGHHVMAEEEGAGGGAADDAHGREQELEASRQGWMPKHKYKGPEGGWKDAATFLSDGSRYNNRLQNELALVKKQLADFQGTAKEFSAFQQRQIEQRDTQIGELVRSLQKEHREAIRSGDDAAADAIEDRIEILRDERGNVKKQIEAAKAPPAREGVGAGVVDADGNTTNPVVTAWIEDGNKWFHDSKPMRDYSFAIANEMVESGITAKGRPFLDLITERMKEAFPKSFAETSDPTRRGSMTDSGSRSGGSGGDHKASDLPDEDRELMKTGIRQGWTTEATFLKNYFSDAPHRHTSAERTK